jgi:hypothetical protein
MSYEFAGCLLNTKSDLLASSACNFMAAAADRRARDANTDAEKLADDCIDCFGLSAKWLADRDIDRDMIASAIADFIKG